MNATSELRHRLATLADCAQLARWNHQLIRDEGHRNAMTVAELEKRMRHWLREGYRAVIFEQAGSPAAYALFKEDPDEIYLRQLFVVRDRRRAGIGRRAVEMLRGEYWRAGTRLTVSVLVDNAGAVAFWRAVGYRDYALTLEILPDSG